MSYVASGFRHPRAVCNELGLDIKDYEGALSTLCAGCGHDSISAALVQACFEMSLPPHRFAKISGIGCSSKTPTYFLGKSHGFNSVHGRMPSLATGANLANRDLIYIGISGDGDTASIGMGQFAHVIRRNLNMLYIVENNGCYGLTKGQDSATADVGSISKSGVSNMYTPMELGVMAMELGATFVGRSFSGDKEQLIPLIKAGIAHEGFAFIDVISPCVTFNNNAGSSKSYDYVRDHTEALGALDYVEPRSEIKASQTTGTLTEISLHDGAVLRLRSTSRDYDPRDRDAALQCAHVAIKNQEILTGLLYINEESKDLHHMLGTNESPLYELNEKDLCPGNGALQDINKSLR
jgi:2-oxoglutarate ferredoxin oxidoreductase subunit beta